MSSMPWLQDLLRLALKATPSSPVPWDHDTFSATTGDKLVDPDDPGKDPRFRALVEAILFGRRFLKTYNLVLLAVLRCSRHGTGARRCCSGGNGSSRSVWRRVGGAKRGMRCGVARVARLRGRRRRLWFLLRRRRRRAVAARKRSLCWVRPRE